MDSKASSLLFIALLCFLSTTSTAFNITKILDQFDGFANFNVLLSQSGLAQEINSRQTVTVLALDDGSIDGLSGRPVDIVKRILSAHVILDYFDQLKISKLSQATTTVTTLYQASGIADDQQGFLRISRTTQGIKFGSAQKGAPLVALLVKSVYTAPYNISVLQVSEPIMTPGIENMAPPPPPGTAAVPKKAPAPAAANKTTPAAPAPSTATTPAKSPAKSPSGAPPPSTEKPSTPAEAPAEGPSSAGEAAGSPEADSPIADGPAAADAPAADAPVADKPKKGASSRMQVGGAAMVVGLLACVMGF